MKRPNADIDRAIASALDDVPPERVSNWCAHIRTRQVGVSFLGEQLGLPIGPKEIACTKLGGSVGAQMYVRAAETFFTSNCAGCQFREPVSDDNIGEAILAAAEAAKANEMAAVAERETASNAARDLADPGLDAKAVLEDDPSTDAQIRGLIGALADEGHGREAAKKLKRAAERWPDLFSERAADVMCGMIRDGHVGDLVLATAWTLSAAIPSIRGRVLREAANIVEERWYGAHPMVASDILNTAIRDGELSPSERLVDGVVFLLRPLVEPPWARGFMSDREPEETPADRLFAALAEHHSGLTLQRVDALLLSEEPNTRAHAATAAARQASSAASTETSLRLANRLLDALALIDDEEEADLSLLASLAACRDSAPDEVTRLIFQRLPTQDLETAKLAVRSLHVGPRHARTTPRIDVVTAAITNRDIPLELRADLADSLADIGRDDPEALWKSFDGLLLVLVQITQERSEILAAEPSGDTVVSTEEFYEIQFARTYSATLRRRSVEAVASAVLWSAEEGIRAISEMLTNATTGSAAPLKAALLEVLGEVGEDARELGRQIVPVVYPHILDPNSHTVRGAAVRALEHLVRYNRNVLPDDVLLLVAQLFHDQYLHPVISGAMDVFARAQVQDRNLAWQVFAATVAMYRAYANDASEYDFIRSLSEVQLNLCRQHDGLAPYAIASMGRMADDAHYYTASRVLQDFGYLACWYPEAHDLFLTKVLDYHRRFNLEIAYGGQYMGPGRGDDRFEDLFDLAPTAIRSRSQDILTLVREGASHRNPEYVATLLLAVAAPDAADAFQLAASRLPDEGQYDPLRAKLTGVEALLRAELTVAKDDLVAAEHHLRDAISGFEAGQERPSKLPFGLGSLPGERNGFLSWARLRRLWISLPDRAASLSEPLAEIQERLQGLPEERTTRDEAVRRIAAALADSLQNLSRWHAAVRSADASAPTFRQAGVVRLHDALEEANSEEVLEYLPTSVHERIQQAIDAVEGQAETASLTPLIAAFRRIPFPVPIEDLPVPRDWKAYRGGTHPLRPSRSDSASGKGADRHRLARVSVEIDGEAPSDVVRLVAGRLYDIGLTFELDEVPGTATELVVQHVCRLPAGSYHFPEETLAVDAGKLRYTVTGTVRFDSPQSEASQPVEIKLLLHATGDDLSTPYELVGLPPLRVRVVSAHLPPDPIGEHPTRHELPSRVRTGTFPPPIHLSCQRDGSRHEVLVDGASVWLTDQNFTLLLRLIRERLGDTSGWVDISVPFGDGLVEAGFLPAEADQAISRFRAPFAPALSGAKPTDLFPRSRGQIRVATPPELITWDALPLLSLADVVMSNEAHLIVDTRGTASDADSAPAGTR